MFLQKGQFEHADYGNTLIRLCDCWGQGTDMRKLKIAVDARNLGSKPSGIGMYLNDFLEQLEKYEEFEWVLFTDVKESEYIKRFEAKGLTVISMNKPVYKSLGVYGYFNFIKKQLREIKPDIFWEVNNLIPVRLKGDFKTLVTIHDMFPIQYVKYFGQLYSMYFKVSIRKTLKHTDMILYNSEQTKNDTEMYFPRAKKIPSCNAYIISNPLTRYVPPKDENYFLYVGNMEKRKGVDILIKAYRRYRENGGTRPLILAGKMLEDDIEQLVESAMTEVEGLTYLGYVSHTTRYDLYNNCSCFVFPSMAEGFGMPILEVMKHNKPILASNLRIFDEIVGDCVERFSLAGDEDDKVISLAEGMKRIDDKINSGLVDEKAYRDALDKYTPERLGGMVRDFINSQMKN